MNWKTFIKCPLGFHEDLCETPIDEKGFFANSPQRYVCQNCGDERMTFKNHYQD